MDPASIRTRPVEQLPEPARFWIGYAPRNWRSAGNLWTDLANARIAGFHGKRGATLPEIEASALEALFYLPPVVADLAEERDRLAVSLIEAGTPVLMQLLPGETTAVSEALVVYDLLGPLLDGDIDQLAKLPPGSTAVWPLIAGITDRSEAWDEICAVLQAAGVRCVQAMVVELNPSLRRQLAEGRGDEVFDALFHGEEPSELLFALYTDRYGLEPFMPRPETGATPRQARNRRIAADLALAGEVWMRLGRAVSQGQALFRAARGAENTHHDLTALVQEDNLTVMNWLDGQGVEIIEEIVHTGQSSLLAGLLDEYQGRDT